MSNFQKRIVRVIMCAPRGLSCEGIAVAMFGRECNRGQRNRVDSALNALRVMGVVQAVEPYVRPMDSKRQRYEVAR